jgi:hypothetical protein
MTALRLFFTLTFAASLAASPGCSVNIDNTDTPPPARELSQDRPTRAAAQKAAPSESDEGPEEETDEQAWAAIRAALGKPGELRDGVYTLSFPRDDFELTVNGNDVPAAAGIASEFHFFRCPCGLINVIGQFVVADYEANDVVDALREGHVEIASIGPLLLHDRPRLMLIRLQGENKRGGTLARTLRTALSWTGKERMAPQKIDLQH